MISMDPEFKFLVNYRLLAMKNESLFWFMPIDYFGHEDLVAVVQSCPSHSLTIVTYYDSVEYLLELVRPYVKNLSWIKLGGSHKEFRYKAGLMSETHYTPSCLKVGIEPWDEGDYEYFEWLEEQALSESSVILNWSDVS